jgi:hypothetical protein
MHVMPDPERRLARVRGRARAGSEKLVPAKASAYLRGAASAATAVPGTQMTADGQTERRRCGRVQTHSEVLVRRLGGFNFNIALKDISSGGCRVEMMEPTAVGDPVIARLPQLEPLGSRVCWADGSTTGLQFLRTIHPAVLDMLLTRLANGETVEPPAVQ